MGSNTHGLQVPSGLPEAYRDEERVKVSAGTDAEAERCVTQDRSTLCSSGGVLYLFTEANDGLSEECN
jgi:hypothetical protein